MIITMTLYPAIDFHIADDRYIKNKTNILRVDHAGKGVNVSRALTENGVDNICYAAVGKGRLGRTYVKSLKESGMDLVYDTVPGKIRINYHKNEHGRDLTTFGEGAGASKRTLRKIEKRFGNKIDEDTFIVLSGALPPELKAEDVTDMMISFKEKGAKILLDSRSMRLSEIKKIRPYLIKPNEDEFEALLGHGALRDDRIRDSLKHLCSEYAECVLLTLGKRGAYLASGDGIYRASVPSCEVRSTTGAGDASVAGFLAACVNGCSMDECLRSSMAYAVSACMTDGTAAPKKEKISEAMDKIKIISLDRQQQ